MMMDIRLSGSAWRFYSSLPVAARDFSSRCVGEMQSQRLRPQAVSRLRSIPHRARRRMAGSNHRSTVSRFMVGNLNRPDRRRSDPEDTGSPRRINRRCRMAVSIHHSHRHHSLRMGADTVSHRSLVATHRKAVSFRRNRHPAHPAHPVRRIGMDGRQSTICAGHSRHDKRKHPLPNPFRHGRGFLSSSPSRVGEGLGGEVPSDHAYTLQHRMICLHSCYPDATVRRVELPLRYAIVLMNVQYERMVRIF